MAGAVVLIVGPVAGRHWWDLFNPFDQLASAAGKVVTDGYTAACLALWTAATRFMALMLQLVDAFLTPDLSATGPAGAVYAYTLWIAAVLMLLMGMAQLGLAAFRRDGRSLATVLIGLGQNAIVWGGWVVYATTVTYAAGGLAKALLQALLGVPDFAGFQPWKPLSGQDVSDAVAATMLAFLGVLVLLAVLGQLLVLLTRAGALLVLAVTTPISAAGLVSDFGRGWFWKSLRWFHAAAFTPVIMALTLGLGAKVTAGVADGIADHTLAGIGTATVGVVLTCISCVAPLALFKLLAFIEPTTSSGAALRTGLAAHGGIQGLISGRSAAEEAGSSAALSSDDHGRSDGESASHDAATSRFAQAIASIGGPVGTGLGMVATVGSKGAGIGSDLANQMGVGHHAYHPDSAGPRPPARSGHGHGLSQPGPGNDGGPPPDQPDDGRTDGVNGGGGEDGGDPTLSATDPARIHPAAFTDLPPTPGTPGGRSEKPGATGPGSSGNSGAPGSPGGQGGGAGAGAAGGEAAGGGAAAAAAL